MKNFAILFFLITFALTAFGQPPQATPKKTPKTAKTVAVKLGTETEEFEKAKAISDATERIAAFQNFIKNFPASTEIPRAQGLIVSARAELGDQKLRAGETQAGIDLFKLAVAEAPTPVSDDLFTKVILGFPLNLDSFGQRAAAFDVVKMIEEKVGANAAQMLDLAKFYINVKYGTEAIRLAQKSVELAPEAISGYQVLAIANRLNFRLEDAANAYAKALELDAESVVTKQSLAEMKRAVGKPDEAIALYREILAKDSANTAAQTGLTLALFDAGKRAEAEAELKKALETEPNNVKLLTGAAYWYAAQNLSQPAIDLSQKAIEADRSFVWAYIAQARALTAQNKPLEAEKVLLAARLATGQYSDFPTFDYELASARLAAGLYREAAEALKKNFTVNKEGLIEAYLGNRILADAKNFTELLSLERRIELFEPNAADNPDNTNKLKSLLEFHQKLGAADATETELAQTAEEFAKGDDNMRLHRQLFAANRLLQKKTALPKVLELMQSAIGGVDSALNVAAPSAAVLADEIYESRQYAISQNLVIVVPEIPRQTLSAILRGRIEDTAGLTYLQQNNPPQSIIRLKRALSVLPDKSAWSRASQWHLGAALEADGKEKEALEAYLKSYDKDLPEPAKLSVIENLYQKVNGNLDGLDARLGQKTDSPVAATENKTAPSNTDNGRTPFEKTPYSVPVAVPSPTPKTPETPPLTTPETKTETKTEPTPEPKTEPKTEPTIESNALPENLPSVTPEKTPEVLPTPTPAETPKTEEVTSPETPQETPKTETSPSPTPTETPSNEVQPTATPATTPSPEPSPTPEETKTEETKQEITPPEATKPETVPEPSPSPQFISDTKTKIMTQFPPSPKTNEAKTVNKTVEPVNKTPEKTPEPIPSKTSTALFEPIIITVGKPETSKIEPPKTENTETKSTDEKSSEPVQKNESERSQKPDAENKTETNPDAENKPETKPIENAPDDKLLSGENRPRIIITEKSSSQTVTEEITNCKILVNMETLSLLSGGGSLGVSVGFEDSGNLKQITATSSSPNDVEVALEPGIGENAGRSFYIIKSVSTKTGVFTVTFEAPCGKKEILVKVR